MKKIFAWAIASMAIFANLAFLAVPNIAHAACSYSATLRERDGKTVVTPSDYLSFSIVIVRQGADNECGKTANGNLYYKVRGGNGLTKSFNGTFSSVTGLGSAIAINTGVDVGSINRADLAQPNILEFFVSAVISEGTFSSKTVTSNSVAIQVSGALGTSGSVKVNVYFFDPNSQSSTKSVFKAEETMSVLAEVNQSDVKKLSSGIKDIYAAFYVNDLSKPIFGASVPRAELESSGKIGKKFVVSTENNFKNGTNILQIKLFESNTSVSVGEGRGTVKIEGMGNTTPTTPGKPTPSDPTALPSPSDPTALPGTSNSSLPETLYNPLPTESLTGTILTIAKGFLAIVALWAVVFIIIGGFRMVLSQGNEEAYLAAKKTITWAVLGVVVAMLSFSIIAIVQSLLGVSVPDFPDSQTPVVENKETSQ